MSKRLSFLLAIAAAVVVASVSGRGPSFALSNGGSITTFGVPLTENFDGLASAGTGIAWADNSTIPGWYSSRTTYNSGTGSSNTGALYSFGVAGTNPVTDRALGSVASSSTGTIYQTARLTNSTGGTITSLDISFVGEQWRDGGNTLAHTLAFDYQVANAGVITGANTPSTGWIAFAPLNFVGPVATATAGALDGNAPGNRVATAATLMVTVNAGQEIWLRWQDPDNAGTDHGLAIDDFSVIAHGTPPQEDAPSVTTTTPANGAINVAVSATVVINFSENVDATASAFALHCPAGSPQTFSQSSTPASSFTLTLDSALPYSTTCTVTVTADQITDTDGNDPPDHMAADFVFSFTTADPPPPGAANVIINEVDADTPDADTAEFIELFDGGVGNTPLDGLVLVLFNGSNSLSYAAFDLDGFSTNASGYFTIGNPGVPGVDLIFDPGPAGLLQNGADAVALYAGNASDFPLNTAVTTQGLVDAIVYDTDDADVPGLLSLLNAGQPQVNENGGGNGQIQSSQRCPNGTGGARNTSTYQQGTPTPDGVNTCAPPPTPVNSPIVISQLYGGGGNQGATYQRDFVELFNRSETAVDITGWSLQYASASGSAWEFTRQPLGGSIGPGEYLLIALASNGAVGAELPPANINGFINMSGTSGKVAVVASFAGLVGNCPLGNPHLMDLVGYGAADCREGTATAPSPSNTTAIFRRDNGATDTNQNGADFVTAAPSPRRTAPIVELGPMVLSTDPRTNGINAPRDATIEVMFTEPVDVVGLWFDITCAGSGSHNDATVAPDGLSYFVTPNVDFTPGEQCTVTLFKDQIHDQDLDDIGPNTDTLRENYTWSFTVANGTAPPDLPSEHLVMGNPTGATADLGQPNNYLMSKPEYALSYSRDLGRPNWVSWHLTDEWIGTLTRVDSFRPDPRVPPDWYRVQTFDFTNTGFNRGHVVPNADRDKETSIPINQATFLMTNMLAQSPDNNQGPWGAFEGFLRTLLPANEIYLVAGGSGTGGTGENGGVTTTIANGHVTVPAFTWKVALVLPKDSGNDINRVSCSTRTIAVILPNTQGIRNTPWETYLTNVDAVEALTGYDLFSNVPPAFQYCIEAGINGVNPPADTTPPTIVCPTADGLWHADNVTLPCTASDSGSGLANAGDASFSLFTSVNAGFEDANASTNSRTICDVSGNCATAVITGNMIDRQAPVITLTTPVNGATYQLNQVVNAAFSCPDGGSGTSTCLGTVPNGAAINTSSLGAKTFTVSATDVAGNSSIVSVSYDVKQTLSTVGPAMLWIGVKSSADAGLRLDLRTELLVDGNVAASGELEDIATGNGGFSQAILQSVGMSLTSGSLETPPGTAIALRVSIRRTCAGGGEDSGRVRMWFNGQPIDVGDARDAGSRIQLTVGGVARSYFLRSAFGLSTDAGSSREGVEDTVNSSRPCAARPYTVLGVWSVTLQ